MIGRGEAQGQEYTVRCMVLYYPYIGGRETRPSLKSTHNSACVGGSSSVAASQLSSAMSYSSAAAARSITYDGSGDGEDSSGRDEASVLIFWGDRLVPGTTMNFMPIDPTAKSKLQCEKQQLPENWPFRRLCMLFLDPDFPHISHNKQEILVSPNFGEWLFSVKSNLRYNPPTTKDLLLQ